MKRVVVCGLSHRAFNMFIKPLTEDFNEHYKITGLLDIDHHRYTLCQERFPSLRGISFFHAGAFDQMVKEAKPDIVIVAGGMTHMSRIFCRHLTMISMSSLKSQWSQQQKTPKK